MSDYPPHLPELHSTDQDAHIDYAAIGLDEVNKGEGDEP
jgi:hypothetical protein